MASALVIKVKPAKVPPSVSGKAASILKKRGVAVLPSDTVYGLAASVSHPVAVRRILKIKGRKTTQPFSIFVTAWSEILALTKNRPPYFSKLKRLLPGPYTFVLPAGSKLPRACISKGKVGLRWPDYALLSKLVRKTGTPLVATSANRSGKPPLRLGREAVREFREEVDLILDAGRLPFRLPSSVVEFRSTEAVILRRGEGYKQLERFLNRIGVPIQHGG